MSRLLILIFYATMIPTYIHVTNSNFIDVDDDSNKEYDDSELIDQLLYEDSDLSSQDSFEEEINEHESTGDENTEHYLLPQLIKVENTQEDTCGQDVPDLSPNVDTILSKSEEEDTILITAMGTFWNQFKGLTKQKSIKRLLEHFSKIKVNNNSEIDYKELHRWVWKIIEHDTTKYDFGQSDMLTIDSNNDGKLSWKELENDIDKMHRTNEVIIEEDKRKWKRKENSRFKHSDENHDNFLTKEELFRFVVSEHFLDMDEMIIEHYLIDYDENLDDVISEQEFYSNNLGNEIEFKQYDIDKDHSLGKHEIRGIALQYATTTQISSELKRLFRTALTKKSSNTNDVNLQSSRNQNRGETLDPETIAHALLSLYERNMKEMKMLYESNKEDYKKHSNDVIINNDLPVEMIKEEL